MEECKKTPCGHHENWYATEQQKTIDRLTEWLEWISEHSIYECSVPDDDRFPYLNMPPNEGADAALNGESIEDRQD
jgi:hypothetical protein